MSDGLQRSAGNNLRRILEVMTGNRFIATFTGVLLTVLVQSSSTTTVMVVGFVNAGLMNLTQAVGTIFGANVGTTVTAQLIAFESVDALALPLITTGVVLHFFVKKKFYKHFGKTILGFGIFVTRYEYNVQFFEKFRKLSTVSRVTGDTWSKSCTGNVSWRTIYRCSTKQ